MDSISKKYGDYKYFSFLEEKDLDKLKDISIKKTYKKDEILFYKGDESKYLHLLVSGIVKLYTHDFKDNEVVIHNLIGPALIAEIMNYEEMDFLANCAFETDAEVYRDWETDRKSTRLNSSHITRSRMPSSA